MKSFLLFAGGFILLGVGVYVGVTFSPAKFLPSTERVVTVEHHGPSVLEKITMLGRLETARYSYRDIVEVKYENWYHYERILLIAVGSATAGYDLAQIKPSDISVNGDVVTINIGAPQIFDVTLDNQATHPYGEVDLGLISGQSSGLETDARRQAVAKIKSDACSGRLLADAESQARKILSGLLSLGEKYQVIVKTSQGKC